VNVAKLKHGEVGNGRKVEGQIYPSTIDDAAKQKVDGPIGLSTIDGAAKPKERWADLPFVD
jgi:hypothetical protein